MSRPKIRPFAHIRLICQIQLLYAIPRMNIQTCANRDVLYSLIPPFQTFPRKGTILYHTIPYHVPCSKPSPFLLHATNKDEVSLRQLLLKNDYSVEQNPSCFLVRYNLNLSKSRIGRLFSYISTSVHTILFTNPLL